MTQLVFEISSDQLKGLNQHFFDQRQSGYLLEEGN